ncbi:dihydroorotase [Candidatus Peregrinibacteria bacterium]|nr:dihydroorotase [Candidatus Peregrinibacteria bacterium]
MSKLLIKNGRLLDPESGCDQVADILIEDGKIYEIDPVTPSLDAEAVDAGGKLVIPGVIDLHVHLRDLEQAYKETIETGTAAALHGGVTTVFTMPNTQPKLDCAERIKEYLELIRQSAKVHVHVVAAISKGLKGEMLAELEAYPDLSVWFITDDGFDIDDEALLEKAYAKAKGLGLTLMTHPEMHSIAPDGVVNEGKISQQLGVPGQPNEKEYKAVERGIRLAKKTGARAHFTHLSAKESIELIRQAKKETDLITCDATPHHFSLTEDLVLTKGGLAKVNPPLRTEADRQAVIEGIKDGTVDAIVTDHAPHSMEEKDTDIKQAAFGFSEVELLIPTTLNELYHKQGMKLMDVIKLITFNPARLAKLESGRIRTGAPADLTIIDLDLEKKVSQEDMVSKGKNTPFDGMMLKGWPVMTVFEGEVYKA